MKKLFSFMPFIALLLFAVASVYFDGGIFAGMTIATAPLAVPEDVLDSLKRIIDPKPEPVETKTTFTDEQLLAVNKIIDAKTKSVKAGFGTNVVKDVGDPESETKAFKSYILGHIEGDRYRNLLNEIKASNDTDMNIGTAADGGYAVPTGHYQGIIEKKNETSLVQRLGVMQIPGLGTTVNVPVESGSANVMVSTTEAAAADRDSPALGQKAMSLVKYTKQIEISEELIQDEDSRLFAFLNSYAGRAMALTENSLLLAEVLANGTALSTTASATAVTAAEIAELPYKIADGYDEGAFKWVMQRATEGKLRTLQGDVFLFNPTPHGTASERNIVGYPVFNSAYAAAYGTATNKFAAFGLSLIHI